MMRWKYFDHTADVMFEAYGKTLEEAFSNTCLAMFNILTDITKVKQTVNFGIKVEASTKEKLLFDFIDELIFLMDTEFVLISSVDNIRISQKDGKYTLESSVSGDKSINYDTHGDIKAPTYNEMSIKNDKTRYTLRVVVDI